MSENRSIKSTRNMVTGFLSKTFNMLLTFVSRTVFIKVFGVEILGINGLFANVLAFLCLADLGFSTAMTYSYYKPIADNDTDKIAALNRFYKKVYLCIAAGIAAIGLALIPFLKYIINLEQEVDHLYIYYLLTLANTVVSYLFVYKTTVLYAHQEGYIVTKYNMIMSTVSVIAQIILMLIFKNYILYLSVSVIFTIINNFYVSHVTDKRYPFINKKVKLEKEDKKGIFGNMGSIFLYKVSSVLMNSTDNIIISKLIGTVTVGFYSNYLTVINMLSSYITILFTSMTASIGNLMVKESSEKQFRVFKDIQVISAWCCIAICPCVYALINDFIIAWIGEKFLIDDLTVIAVIINFFLICILNPIWIFREAAGIYRKTKYIMVICAVINIVLSVIMGKMIGLSGVIFASAISKLFTYIWYEPIILFRDYFKKSPLNFFASSLGIVAITAATCVLLYYVKSFIVLEGIIGFLVKGLACFVLSNIVFAVIFCKNKYFHDLIRRGLNLLNGIKSRFLKSK